MPAITPEHFRVYRKEFGFTNADRAKDFLAAKDIIPKIDYEYLQQLNERLCKIVQSLNEVIPPELKVENVGQFCNEKIRETFAKLDAAGILPKLNNQGRRPEQVYFSWMRGYLVANFVLRALSFIFKVEIGDIQLIGEDDLNNPKAFKRGPTADLQLNLQDGRVLRLEIQSGFQGINDIKQHKVLEARRIKEANPGTTSFVIHFDIYNGQVAFVRLDTIKDDSTNWESRQQMEGQKVFSIDQSYFIWKLNELPPSLTEVLLD